MYGSQIIMVYTFMLYSAVRQLCLSKRGGKENYAWTNRQSQEKKNQK